MQENPTYSICCHTRDFEYINDFIEHHLNLGFDKIVIYDNMSITPVVYDHPKVEIILWNKPIIKLSTYNDFIKKYSNLYTWTAFIDEDEFINTKNRSIQEVMDKFQHYDSLALNWRIFGDYIDFNNLSTKISEKYLYHVPENYEELNPDPNNLIYIKSIVKNCHLIKYNDPHFPILKSGKFNKGVQGQRILGSVTSIKDVESEIWIDHYYFRGLDNYLFRQSRYVDISKPRSIEAIKNMYYSVNPLANKKRTI